MFKVRIIKKHTTPLCFLPSGDLVCYQFGKLLIMRDDKCISEHLLFPHRKEIILGRINLLYRLFRLGVRAAEAIDENRIVLSVGNYIYEYDFIEHNLSHGYYIGDGIRPLIFTSVKGVNGFEDCLCFGGYKSNKNKEPIHIYKRLNVDKWDIVYTFAKGHINHVHNIVVDNYRHCLWAFTGDFDEASAIWRITDNFRSVKRVLYNDQKYRGCVIYPIKEGLLYATDSPFARNYIYLMKEDYSIDTICEIDGSCIYGCKLGDKFVLSTAVEPDGRHNTRWKLLTSRKRGAGIKDMYTHLYYGNILEGFSEVYREKKDIWPFIFQFGVFKFPNGLNKSHKVYFQPVATAHHDLDLMILEK